MVLADSDEAKEEEERPESEPPPPSPPQPLEDEKEAEAEAEGVDEEEGEGEEEEEEEEEFSFVCVDPEGSPISADDIFSDGLIKPVYPLFNQALIFGDQDEDSTSPRPQLRKIFVEHPASSSSQETENPATGTFCEWSDKSASASPDRCKKSNSTGFSKVWRFRDLLHRSSSDGKDAFVFLHPSTAKKSQEELESGKASTKRDPAGRCSDEVSVRKGKAKAEGSKTGKPVSAHERHYMRNRVLKEEGKRRSYLPYKVGFFTSVSGLSRNVHPF
uniref:Uncharacterized protein n=1 Tax=Kalanchoe fedtschenkoi TaxID=63787 RepID=A0A7N0TEV7_KALFE